VIAAELAVRANAWTATATRRRSAKARQSGPDGQIGRHLAEFPEHHRVFDIPISEAPVLLKATAPTLPSIRDRTSALRDRGLGAGAFNWASGDDSSIVGKDEGQRDEIADGHHCT